jgi:hypothetical protein
VHPVAEGDSAAHPHALASGGRELVADSLAGNLALELGEGEQHVEREAPHGSGSIELLGDGDEGNAVGVEDVHKLGEVGQRAGEAVDLVENDQVGLAGADVSQELLQRRALEGAARETAIVVAGGERDPAFVTLAPMKAS